MAQYDILLQQNVHATGTEYTEKYVNVAKGGLVSADGSQTPTVLAGGTDGYVLVRDDVEATGLKWIDPSTLLTYGTDGQIPYVNATDDGYSYSSYFVYSDSAYSLTLDCPVSDTSWLYMKVDGENVLRLSAGSSAGIYGKSLTISDIDGVDASIRIGNYGYTSTYLTIKDQDSSTPMTNTLVIVDTSYNPIFRVLEAGDIYIPELSSDDTEDHVLAIDDSTGLVSKRSVASIGASVSFGSDNQVPYMDGTTDFQYSADFTFDDTDLTLGNANSRINIGGEVVFTERADHVSTPTAGYGYLWVRSDSPCVLVFTNDAGTDTVLGAAGSTTFVSLTDTPSAYTGAASKLLVVNNTPDAVEFWDIIDFTPITDVADTDEFLVCLAAGGNRAITWANLKSEMVEDLDLADLTQGANGGIAAMTYDGSTAETVELDFTNLTNETALADADEFAYNDDGAGMRALTYSALKTALNTDLTFGSSDVSVANQGDNRIVTATATTDALNAEQYLQFDGTDLAISSTNGRLTLPGDIVFAERADHASTPTDGYGYLWVRSDTPCVLVFTNDAGTDTVLGAAGGVDVEGTPSQYDITVWHDSDTITFLSGFNYTSYGLGTGYFDIPLSILTLGDGAGAGAATFKGKDGYSGYGDGCDASLIAGHGYLSGTGAGGAAFVYGGNAYNDSPGGNVTINAGDGAGTGDGGKVYIYPGAGGGSGSPGEIYFGTGSSGWLIAKTSETNVVYYDTATGKLSYGAVAGGVSFGTDNQIPYMDSTTDFQYSADFTFDDTDLTLGNANSRINIGGEVVFAERADHVSTPTAGYGYLWVRNDAPSSLIFTDDAGTDYDLTAAGASTFLALSDTPGSYSGAGGYMLMVDSTPDAVEFVDPSGYALSNFSNDLFTPAALTKSDDTNVTLTLGGTPATALLQATSLTLGWTGQLSVARGGTAKNSVAQYSLLYASAADTYGELNLDGNGELIIGGTSGPAVATLGDTDGVRVTVGDQTISIGLDFTDSYLTNETALADADEFAYYDSGVGMRALTYAALKTALDADLSPVSFGGDENEIPFTNSAGDDFDYDSTFRYEAPSLILAGTDSCISITGDILIGERADHVSTPAAGMGYLWVKNDDPSSLIFTDDVGTDYDLTAAGATTFVALTDTPSAYTGAAYKLVAVNGTPDALVFLDIIDFTPITDVADTDEFLVCLAAGGNRAITWANLKSEMVEDLDLADLTQGANGGIAAMTYDGSTAETVELDFTNLTNETTLADADEFAYNDDGAGMRALTYSALKTALNTDLSFVTATSGSDNRVAVFTGTSGIEGTINLVVDDAVPSTTLQGDLAFVERADHASTPSGGYGYLWVRSDTPNVLVFTNDAGTDTVLGAASYTFQNGINESGGTVELGGALTETTTIYTGSLYDMNIAYTSSGRPNWGLNVTGDGGVSIWYDLTDVDETANIGIDGTYVRFSMHDDNGDEVSLVFNRGTGAATFTDEINSLGLVYAADYSGQFTDRSLVDKAYVDSVAAAVTFGTDNQVPYMDGTTDFQYSANLTFDDTNLKVGDANYTNLSGTRIQINNASTDVFDANPTVADGAGAIAYLFRSANDLTTSGAKLASFNNNGTEKLAVDLGGDIVFVEKADHTSTPTAGYGYLWVRSDTPSSLIFTDDTGTDYDLTAAAGITFGTDNQIPYTNSGGDDFDYSDDFIYDGTTLVVTGDGTASPETVLIQNEGVTNAHTYLALKNANDDTTTRSIIQVFRSRGSLGTPSDNSDQDTILSMIGVHYNASGWRYAMSMDWHVGDDTGGGYPTYWLFRNTKIGDTSRITVMSITENNQWGLTNYATVAVDTIETTLTDDDTHIPTSGAVYTAIAAVDAPTYGTDNQIPYMDGTTDFQYSANLIFDDANLTIGSAGWLYLGSSQEFGFRNSGNTNYITSTEHGSPLLIQAEDTGGTMRTLILADPDNSVGLYYNGSQRLITSTDGVTINGCLYTSDDLVLGEAADHTYTPAAGLGILWVRNDDPNVLMFTDDAGNDVCISSLFGTKYYSIPGTGFLGQNAYEADIEYDVSTGECTVLTDDVDLVAAVHLPDGAVVTSIIVYGNAGATAETYELIRVAIATPSGSQMATANIGTADSSITNPTIDNSTYAYFIVTSTLDTSDEVWGARITYTYSG